MRLERGEAAKRLAAADSAAAQQAQDDGEGERDDEHDEAWAARLRVSAVQGGDVDAEVEEGAGTETYAFVFLRPEVLPPHNAAQALFVAVAALGAAAAVAEASGVRIAQVAASSVAYHAGEMLVRAALERLVHTAEAAAAAAGGLHGSTPRWSVGDGLELLRIVRETRLGQCDGVQARLLAACVATEADRQQLVALSLDDGARLLQDAARAHLTSLRAEADAAQMHRRLAAGKTSIPGAPHVNVRRLCECDLASDMEARHFTTALLKRDAFGAQRRTPVTPALIDAAFKAGTCPGLLASYLLEDPAGKKALEESQRGWHIAVAAPPRGRGMPPVVATDAQMNQLVWQILGDLGLMRTYVEQHAADGTTCSELRRVLVRMLEVEGYGPLWALDRPSDADDAPFLLDHHPELDMTDVVLVCFGSDAASARVHELFNLWRDAAGTGFSALHRYGHAGGGTLGMRTSIRPSPLEPRLRTCPTTGVRAVGAEVLWRGAQPRTRDDLMALGFTRSALGMGRLVEELVLPALGCLPQQSAELLLDSASPAEARWWNVAEVSTAA